MSSASTPRCWRRRRPSRSWPATAWPSAREPIALAYAGHQFGNFVPQLGDGRAVLLGEVVDARRRAARHPAQGLRAARRSRAAAMAVRRWARCCANTSSARRWPRSASRPRARSRRSPPASRWCARRCCRARVLTRVATSHIRVGTFQFFAARGDGEALRLLADHVIARHYPDARDEANPTAPCSIA